MKNVNIFNVTIMVLRYVISLRCVFELNVSRDGRVRWGAHLLCSLLTPVSHTHRQTHTHTHTAKVLQAHTVN